MYVDSFFEEWRVFHDAMSSIKLGEHVHDRRA
jgi:hypothetical protein